MCGPSPFVVIYRSIRRNVREMLGKSNVQYERVPHNINDNLFDTPISSGHHIQVQDNDIVEREPFINNDSNSHIQINLPDIRKDTKETEETCIEQYVSAEEEDVMDV